MYLRREWVPWHDPSRNGDPPVFTCLHNLRSHPPILNVDLAGPANVVGIRTISNGNDLDWAGSNSIEVVCCAQWECSLPVPYTGAGRVCRAGHKQGSLSQSNGGWPARRADFACHDRTDGSMKRWPVSSCAREVVYWIACISGPKQAWMLGRSGIGTKREAFADVHSPDNLAAAAARPKGYLMCRASNLLRNLFTAWSQTRRHPYKPITHNIHITPLCLRRPVSGRAGNLASYRFVLPTQVISQPARILSYHSKSP